MSKQIVRFVSRNKQKVENVRAVLERFDIEIIPVPLDIEELRTQNMTRVAKDKVLKAFQQNGRPLIVEQTGLEFPHLNGYRIGSYYNLWETAGPERLTELFGRCPNPRVILVSIIAYVDGRRIRLFDSQIAGIISESPRGKSEYPWESIFIPDGEEKTIAERGNGRIGLSLRSGALEKFAKHLIGRREERP